ncbi:alpha-arabinosides ABC transport system [Gracilibacillus boraciitolerans JCM 21714]|uniref:Alpha-arabinosides ABC transport system n=1 Tax=Gracilibacillus boraciitolerans JCM 21714 TaxID=1298598 RepID=W4VHB2_9BACI|nr:alpha-arabinosides ABC transport system [Gracilibacillus boraciitolerans JCM 21714]
MKKLKRVFIYLFLSMAAIVSIFPFLWMLVSMTNKSVDVTKGRLIPGTHFIENFQKLLEQTQIGTAIGNSLIIAVITTFLTLLIGSLAGYGFEIYRSKRKDMVFNILILSMMIPFAAIMIPLYRLFGQISDNAPLIGLDTLAAAFLPTVITAFFIFFFRQNTKMFAKELVEAGRIDGLSELGIFFRIYLPTMKTTYAAAALLRS